MPASMDQEPYRVDAKVELTKPPEPEAGIDWPAWIQAISPILLALVGLYFTDTVANGIRAAAAPTGQRLGHAGAARAAARRQRLASRSASRGVDARLVRTAGGGSAGQRACRLRRCADAGDRGRASRDRLEQCRSGLRAIDEYHRAPIRPILVADVPLGDPRHRRCSMPVGANVIRVIRAGARRGLAQDVRPGRPTSGPACPPKSRSC